MSHRCFILITDIGQRQGTVDRKTLLSGHTAEQLELWANEGCVANLVVHSM